MKHIIPFLFVISLISCSDTDVKKEEINHNDSSVVTDKISGVTFDERTFKQLQLPLLLDTNFVMNADTSNRIHYAQVRGLKSSFLNHSISGAIESELDEFCRIDSLKEKGAYNDYVKALDIGMLKNSIAFRLGWVDLKNGTKLFLWGLEYSSYEACPFYSGKIIIGTLANENMENISFLLAGRTGGGDPPSVGNDDITSKISTDGTIDMLSVGITDDMDVPGHETRTETAVIKLENGKVVVKDSKKTVQTTENTDR